MALISQRTYHLQTKKLEKWVSVKQEQLANSKGKHVSNPKINNEKLITQLDVER